MKLAYVFMNYLAPSEVFGRVEINSLKAKDVNVQCFSIFSKFKHLDKKNDCTYIDIYGQLFSILKLFLDVKLFFGLMAFCFTVSKTKKELLKNIIIIPRSLVLAENIMKDNPDVVHLFWGHYPSLLIYLLKHKGCSAKYSVFVGAYDLESGLGIMEWGVNNADVVFTHAKYNKELISKFFDGHINVLYRGIKISNDVEVKNTLNNDFNFISVGRLDYSKRPDLVLNAYCYILDRTDISPTLTFCGGGSMKEELEESARKFSLESTVNFKGHLEQSELFEIVSNSDFMLFASEQKSERLPNSVKECMNLGCIPLVSKTPGIEELVKNGVNGFIVDFNAPDSIYGIISTITKDPKKIVELKKNAKNTVNDLFDVDKLAEERIRLYKEVLK